MNELAIDVSTEFT